MIKKLGQTRGSAPTFLFAYLQSHSVRIGAELRRILALDQGIAVVEVAFLGHEHAVLQLMRTLGQALDEELHVGVGVGLVVAHAVVVLVTRDLLNRLETSGAEVFDENIAHILLTREGDFYGNFITYF